MCPINGEIIVTGTFHTTGWPFGRSQQSFVIKMGIMNRRR